MSSYQITCDTKSPRTSAGHQHIVGVGIAGSGYTVPAIYQHMDAGHRFYTESPSTGRLALVDKDYCCGIHTLRSRADAIWDNNLDNLSPCR